MTASTGKKTGRPSKGRREAVRFLVPPEIKHAAQAKAQSLGMTLTDYLTEFMARDSQLAPTKEGLPFDDSAVA